jgi:hypothetical protein
MVASPSLLLEKGRDNAWLLPNIPQEGRDVEVVFV